PAARYGSWSAHACASANESNSATTKEPVKPASPGSVLAIAGQGPATNKRPSANSCSSRAKCAGRVARRAVNELGASSAQIANHIIQFPLHLGHDQCDV